MLVAFSKASFARSCDGPSACCAEEITHDAKSHVVKLGVVILGLSNLSERSGTWDADYYLVEHWQPNGAFTPQTEVVNELARLSTQYDITEIRDNECVRSRRIRSTLRTPYNLRAFPFDMQSLSLQISDDEYTAAELSYDSTPDVVALDDGVKTTLSSWKLEADPQFHHEVKAFRWEKGAPSYDNATVEFVVRRHVTYHLFKFFLPLLVIVALAFTVFWIDPDDLSAAATIGVTCLLAAIAFQFAEASTLPEVAYLTLADRVYVACYIAIGAALIETIYSSALARRGMKKRAVVLDERCRSIFPFGLVFALVVSVIRALTET